MSDENNEQRTSIPVTAGTTVIDNPDVPIVRKDLPPIARGKKYPSSYLQDKKDVAEKSNKLEKANLTLREKSRRAGIIRTVFEKEYKQFYQTFVDNMHNKLPPVPTAPVLPELKEMPAQEELKTTPSGMQVNKGNFEEKKSKKKKVVVQESSSDESETEEDDSSSSEEEEEVVVKKKKSSKKTLSAKDIKELKKLKKAVDAAKLKRQEVSGSNRGIPQQQQAPQNPQYARMQQQQQQQAPPQPKKEAPQYMPMSYQYGGYSGGYC